MKLRQAIALALLVPCACRSVETPDSATFEDLGGSPWQPLEVQDATAHVLIFVTTDCPIANSYAPEIRSIATDHADDPLRFFIVHVDPDVDVETARQHARDYDLPGPILLDSAHRLARHLGIETTPEAAVLSREGALVYRGRIDNWWGDLGRKRPHATQHELRDALREVLAGQLVTTPRTRAIGCDLPVL